MHRHHRRRQLVGRDVDRPPHRVLANLRLQLRSQIRGERVRRLQHRVHQRAELRAHRQVRHRRRHVRADRRRRQRDLRDLVVQLDDLGLAAHRRRLRGANQPGVRRPPPRRVDLTVEVPRGEVRARLFGRQCGHLCHHRLLDDEAARRLPLREARHRVVVRDLLRRNTIRHHGLTRVASRATAATAHRWVRPSTAPTTRPPATARASSRHRSACCRRWLPLPSPAGQWR